MYRNGSLYAIRPLYGNFTSTVGVTVGLDNITKIVVRNITDTSGVGFDDFSFNVPADVKITSGRVNGYLNGTTQNALLGGDVALNASPLPGAFAGGSYSWSCAPAGPTQCSITSASNASSVTLRTNEVGTYTVNLSYTKGGITASSSVTINSVLPTLTSFTAQQRSDRIHRPFDCGHPFPYTIFWFYGLGCLGTEEGISFESHTLPPPSYISDPTESGIKYVQAVSAFRKRMSRGIRCETRRTSESNVASGWQLDTKDPYDCCHFLTVQYFSFINPPIFGPDLRVTVEDYPDEPLTWIKDFDFVDSLYIDDRFEMYVMYFAGNKADQPWIQRPLGKLAWNWGGQVVFDWDSSITDAVHKIRSTNAPPRSLTGQIFPPSMQKLESMVTMNGNVTSIPTTGTQCPDGPALTDNPIDSAREFVKYHYIDFLGRDPNGNPNANPPVPADPVGWNFWTSNISQCIFDLNCVHAKRISTGLAFFLSSEFIQNDPIMANGPGTPNFNREAYNREFVFWCYQAYIHKFPDQQGWDFWTNDLNRNVKTYADMIDAFQVCDDYRNKRVFE